MERTEEIHLIAEVAMNGSHRAFARLMEAHQGAVRRFLLVQTGGNAPLADDLAQDTFIKAYRHIAAFQGRSAFLTWLFRIAYNVHLDYVRSAKQTTDLEAANQQSNKNDTANGMKLDLNKALAILTPNEKICVTLQLMEQQTLERIAEITQLNINTVKSHLARGKQKMAEWLRSNGYG